VTAAGGEHAATGDDVMAVTSPMHDMHDIGAEAADVTDATAETDTCCCCWG